MTQHPCVNFARLTKALCCRFVLQTGEGWRYKFNKFCDHRGLSLLFGVITKATPLRLITQFHGEKMQSVTLDKAIIKLNMDKPSWLGILKNSLEALSHCHKVGVLHNDTMFNNILLKKREQHWNPVVIDVGKARFISNPKPLTSLSASAQEKYRKLAVPSHRDGNCQRNKPTNCGVRRVLCWKDWAESFGFAANGDREFTACSEKSYF